MWLTEKERKRRNRDGVALSFSISTQRQKKGCRTPSNQPSAIRISRWSIPREPDTTQQDMTATHSLTPPGIIRVSLTLPCTVRAGIHVFSASDTGSEANRNLLLASATPATGSIRTRSKKIIVRGRALAVSAISDDAVCSYECFQKDPTACTPSHGRTLSLTSGDSRRTIRKT